MPPVRSLDLDRLEDTRRRLEALCRRLREQLPVERIILFGSFAKGRVHEGSDIDLLVIGRFAERFFDRGIRVAEMNRDCLPIQALCYTPEEFERMQAAGNPLIREALATGTEL